MKKRFLSVFLSLMMCLTLLPTAVLAEDSNESSSSEGTTAEESHTNHCVCGATHKSVGDHTDANTITNWTPASSLAELNKTTEGTYYLSLTDDVEIKSTESWVIGSTTNNNRSDETTKVDIVLCLNGHTITVDNTGSNENGYILVENGSLTITDCKGSGKITGVENGSKFKLAITVACWDHGCTLNLYGGTITNFTVGNGGGVHNEGIFNMYGGTITGNTATNGGGVYTYTNTTYVKSGKATEAVFNMYGGTISSNTATNGGGVFNNNSGTFTMTGGTISGNTAGQAPGNDVHNWKNSTMNANGGTVAGAVYNEHGTITTTSDSSTGTTTFNGDVKNGNTGYASTISGGTYNGTVTNSSGTGTTTGGTISGGTFNGAVTNSGTGTNGGTISGGTFNGTVTNQNGSTVTSIDGSVTNNGAFVFENGSTKNGDATFSGTGYVVTETGNGNSTLETNSGETLSGEVTVSTAAALAQAVQVEGVTKITLTDNITLSETLEVARDLTLDLNGHVLQYAGTDECSVIAVRCGTSGEGSSTATTSPTNFSIMDSAPNTEHKFSVGENGLWVLDEENDTETVKGGVITGGTGYKDPPFGNSPALGGGIYAVGSSDTVTATVTMSGGTIVGCTANRGAGVYIDNFASFTMNGTAQICGCVAVEKGDAVYVSNGTLTLGDSTTSENIYIHDRTVGNSGETSGAIYSYCGTIYANNGQVKGTVYNDQGKIETESASSGTVFHNAVTNEGGTISGGVYNGAVNNKSATDIGDPESSSKVATISGGVFYGDITGDNISFTGNKVTFEPNNGDHSTVYVVSNDTTIQPITQPTKDGYIFGGWYAGENTTAWNFDTDMVTENITLYAKWTTIGSSRPSYSVTVSDTDNGSVSVRPKRAKKGTNVTITVTPDEGYVLETLAVTDKNGKEIDLTARGDGTYTFKMPNSKVTVNATFQDDNTMLSFFVDVPADSYYYDAVLWATENGITTGVDDTHFGPDLTCTRAQLVTFLWRTAGCPVVDDAIDFTDVGEDAYYTEAVRWAASLGIVDGYGNGLFGSDDDITREQVVTILYRYAAAMGFDVSVGEDTNILSYNDASEVSEYAVSAFQWATGAGIVQGADGNLMPKDHCTRAQIVTMLYRFCETIDETI